MSGKQASAAATLEGRPVEVALAVESVIGGGVGVGSTGSIGSTGSGMSLVYAEFLAPGKLCFARDFAYPRRAQDDTVRPVHAHPMEKSLRGFTLIELLVVIVVIAILISLALPVFNTVQERGRMTQDLNNLRQIGIATQTYLNDNDNVLFTTGGIWMTQLHPKYLPSWKIFQSPFDHRVASEDNAAAPVSYGFNGHSVIGISADKIVRPTAFILFAPAQAQGAVVAFSGIPAAAVTVYRATSSPGGVAVGGTHNRRTRINALFADLHVENMAWTDFLLDQDTGNTQADANFRWDYGGHGVAP
jgi:prepilin-type N-terminal cleavage/methylation domain-containing protein/prepilin-type processing-associated H-X9-DG protein